MTADSYWRSLLAVALALALLLGFTPATSAQTAPGSEARDIAAALNCPVCQGRSVADSPAPLAQEMRTLIEKKLEQGASRDEILQYFVDRYGEGILRQPPGRGFNLALWWLPVLVLLGGAAAVARILLISWRSGRSSSGGVPEEIAELADLSEEDLARYERQLEEDLGGQAWDSSGRTESVNLDTNEEGAEMASPTRRSPKGEAVAQEASSTSSGQRDLQSRRRPGARPTAGSGTMRSRPKAGSGSARRHGWIIAVAVAIALVLLLAIVGRSYLSPQGPQPIATLQTADVHALAISPKDGNVVFFGHHNGILRSDDGGRNWQPVVAQKNFDAMELAIPLADAQTIYAAGHGIFYRSTDGGKTWESMANALPYDDVHGFALDARDPKNLYAFVVGYGLLESGDGGASWKSVDEQLPQSIMSLAAAPDNPRTLFAGTMDEGILRSLDGGLTWQPDNNGIDTKDILSLSTSTSAAGLVYAGTDKGLFRSNDGGGTWSPTSFQGVAASVAVAPDNPKTLLVVDDKTNVYRSDDGGVTWGSGR